MIAPVAVATKVAVDVTAYPPCPLALRPPAPSAGFRALFERDALGDPARQAPAIGPILDPPATPRSISRPVLSGAAAHPPVRLVPRTAADRADEDPLDPLHRHRAALAPPDIASFSPAPAALPSASPTSTLDRAPPLLRSSLEDLIPALVRRVAWSGDARRGTARLEIGAGELAGATLLVHADGGHVRVRLDVPSGVDAVAWQRRIVERLALRNIPTDAVEVA